MRLQDRVAVVTGGGGGIGSGICLALAREGADVVVSDIDLEAAERCASQVRKRGGGAWRFGRTSLSLRIVSTWWKPA